MVAQFIFYLCADKDSQNDHSDLHSHQQKVRGLFPPPAVHDTIKTFNIFPIEWFKNNG